VEDVTAHSFGIDMLNQHDEVKNLPFDKQEYTASLQRFQLWDDTETLSKEIAMGVYRTEESIPRKKEKLRTSIASKCPILSCSVSFVI
jgi:hypothetical protein